jgi:hypothetical protein
MRFGPNRDDNHYEVGEPAVYHRARYRAEPNSGSVASVTTTEPPSVRPGTLSAEAWHELETDVVAIEPLFNPGPSGTAQSGDAALQSAVSTWQSACYSSENIQPCIVRQADSTIAFATAKRNDVTALIARTPPGACTSGLRRLLTAMDAVVTAASSPLADDPTVVQTGYVQSQAWEAAAEALGPYETLNGNNEASLSGGLETCDPNGTGVVTSPGSS